jgi:hypothetical protein
MDKAFGFLVDVLFNVLGFPHGIHYSEELIEGTNDLAFSQYS